MQCVLFARADPARILLKQTTSHNVLHANAAGPTLVHGGPGEETPPLIFSGIFVFLNFGALQKKRYDPNSLKPAEMFAPQNA